MKRLWEAWDQLWFAPVDARPLGAMRVSLGLLLLWWWAWLGPELELMFHDDGVFDPTLIRNDWMPARWDLLQGWTLPQLQAGHAAGLLVLAAYTLGLGTPLLRFVVPMMLVAVLHRAPWAWNGGDRLIRIWALILALTPCGTAWSVDAWLRQRLGRPVRETVPVLGLRLVQLQLVVMYTWTGLDKLRNASWRDGTAIYQALSDGHFNRFPALIDPLMATDAGLWASAFLVVATLIFEAGFLPLVAWRRTRVATLLAGVALHLGIFVTMSVGMFGPASVWGYQAFLADRWPPRGGSDTSKRLRPSADT